MTQYRSTSPGSFSQASVDVKTVQKTILDEVAKKPQSHVCVTKGIVTERDFVMQFFRERNGVSQNQVIEFNKSTDDKKVGVQNFDGNTLPINQSVSIIQLAIGYATNVAANKGTDLTHTTAFPPLVRNSMLEIHQDGKMLVELPMAEFDPRTTGNNVDDQYYNLINPFKLIPNKPFEFKIRTPEVGTTVADYSYFEVRAKGQITIGK